MERRRSARSEQSSTMTVDGRTVRMSSRTSSALCRDTCAVPTRKICAHRVKEAHRVRCPPEPPAPPTKNSSWHPWDPEQKLPPGGG